MRNNPVSPALVATALSACAFESELLNSERIVERFGNYGIEVLQHDADIRRTSLYSLEDGLKVCRTYAVVQFHNAATTSVADAHAAILAGNSIGETFKAAGWSINKMTLHVGGLPLPTDESEIRSLMRLDDEATLGMHAYRLILAKDGRAIEYATIIEAHHPDYLGETELKELFARDSDQVRDEAQIERLQRIVLGSN